MILSKSFDKTPSKAMRRQLMKLSIFFPDYGSAIIFAVLKSLGIFPQEIYQIGQLRAKDGFLGIGCARTPDVFCPSRVLYLLLVH